MTILLLQLFIVTFPIHGFQILMSTHYYSLHLASPKNHFALGILFALCGILTIQYPILIIGNEFHWDLRLIPIILSFTFGGGLGGLVCLIPMSLFRFYLGGDSCLYGLTTLVIIGAIAWQLGKRFYRKTRRVKLLIVVWTAIIGIVAKLLVMLLFFNTGDRLLVMTVREFTLLSILFCFQIFCIGILTVWMDQIIQSRFLRDRLQRAEKMHLLSEMAASVAHEVRNPLQVTRGYLQLAMRRCDPPTVEQLQTAMQEVDRASGIISEYLSFAKPRLDAIVRIDVKEEIFNAVAMMESVANMEGVLLKVRCSQMIYFQGDSGKFKQILINLIKNSIEASSGKGEVCVEAHLDENEVVVQVRDQGEGMTEEEVRQLGSPFYSTKTKGTGIGLMVTFRLVEVMNGRLSFISKKGEGTKAILSFPAA